MMPTASTTAVIMIEMSSAMPTAVITESSEKTMSSSMIWTMTARERRRDARRAVALFAFEPLVNLERRLAEQEQAAADQDQVAARDARGRRRVKSGAVSRMIQAIDSSSRMRMHHGGEQAASGARGCCCAAGSLPDENRDEDDVVDAEHDLEKGQRDEREQAVGGEESIHTRNLADPSEALPDRRRFRVLGF